MTTAGYIRISKLDVDDAPDRDAAIAELVRIRTKELTDAAGPIADEHLYIDLDLSGTSVEKRPRMMQMIAAAKRGEISTVYTKNLSRLFRNLAEQTVYIAMLEKSGVRLITLQEPSEGEKPILDLTRNVLGSVNQYLAAVVGQQIKANNRIVASTGRLAGGRPPLGYRYDRETKELTPDPDRARDAVVVFRVYAEERGFTRTAGRLNALGIKTRDGYTWRHDKVKLILTNPIYRGLVHFDGEEWPGKHEKIIPDALLAEVDAILAERCGETPWNGTMRTHRLTYSGLLHCGLCGARMRARTLSSAVGATTYWVCGNRQDRMMCDAPSYRTDDLDVFVRPGIIAALSGELDSIRTWYETEPRKPEPPPTDPVEAQIAGVNRKMQRIAAEYADGYMERETYRKLMDEYRRVKQNLEAQRTAPPVARTPLTAEDITRWHETIEAEWDEAEEEARHLLIRSIAPRIVVHPDRLILQTRLEAGEVTIPTGMFRRRENKQNGQNEHHPNGGAPDRSEASGTVRNSPLPFVRWVLGENGKQVRKNLRAR